MSQTDSSSLTKEQQLTDQEVHAIDQLRSSYARFCSEK